MEVTGSLFKGESTLLTVHSDRMCTHILISFAVLRCEHWEVENQSYAESCCQRKSKHSQTVTKANSNNRGD